MAAEKVALGGELAAAEVEPRADDGQQVGDDDGEIDRVQTGS